MSVPSEMGRFLQECRRALQIHYGERFRGLVLYGSTARGEAREESDIDLLVLLDEDFDYFAELREMTDVLYPLQLVTDRHLSALPAPVQDFETGALQLYRNAAEEGLRL